MQQDDLIWSVIYNHFCAFQIDLSKREKGYKRFCQNQYNLTGLCERKSCPLANSTYATVREEKGKIFLCIKSIERAHSPKNLWERVELPTNYLKALEKVDELLEHFPKFQVHRSKQRLTKLHQMLIRMRRLKAEEIKHGAKKLVPISKKLERQERTRERKALAAAKIEKNIEAELLSRLKKGKYGNMYNLDELKIFENEDSEESELEVESLAEEEEDEEVADYQFEEGESDDSEAEMQQIEELNIHTSGTRRHSISSELSGKSASTWNSSSTKKKPTLRVEYEYETENDTEHPQLETEKA